MDWMRIGPDGRPTANGPRIRLAKGVRPRRPRNQGDNGGPVRGGPAERAKEKGGYRRPPLFTCIGE